jgi:hypothetical protein
MANRNKAEKEVNEALARIQKSLGVEDGGFASVYFTGDNGEKLDAAIELIAEYIEAEVGFQLG